MKYSLRQLEIFLATAHHENLTLAAKELAMSQSAASESLKTLEQQFDIQLFDRAGKSLKLNELGQALRVKAEALINQAKALENDFRLHTDIGDIKVGASLSIGNYLAVNIVAQFMGENPQATVSLEVENMTAIVHKVKNFTLDIGLIEGEINDADIDTQFWRKDELVAFCSPNHPLAQRGTLTEADLLNAQWILREPGSGTRQTFDWAMRGILPELSIAIELQHTEAIKRAVEANLGVGCLSKITLEDAFKRGTLVPLAVPSRNFERNLYFILHKDKYISAGIEKWLALCQSPEYVNP
ncbi:LysR substrate-binding domain-containing protein [Reinekea marina]|uniref:LysR substrate-binding domain-containing protein n=1 Tax=Reinekea marina TaxID=1310421 RepID=A0ABV7WU24_9GAMM|nr:LysR substrate-binding domain-containing protein [Reinekea marina]MDN3650348.1 LysR substrate-binding domain-containing protein [Reinekea marina]